MRRGSLVVKTCASAVFAIVAILGGGCDGGECGLGTLRYGNTCVTVDPFDKTPPTITVDPPLITRSVGIVRLTSDEPATIYYTIDGSDPTLDSSNEADQVVIPNVPDDAQLRYFAVDLAGNQSDEESRLWVIDRDGPAAPSGFDLMLNGATRTVTWSPPPDPRFGGVIVARVEGALVSPVPGKTYAVGDLLGPGVTVVDVTGAAATGPGTFTETMPAKPGLVRYAAWAFDALQNYGPPAGDYEMVAVPAQTGSISVDAGSGNVTVTTQPANVHLSGAATLAGSTLSVKLTLRNDTTRVLFAPKLRVTSAVAGVTWSNSDGTLDAAPYRAYGGAIQPGTSATATWTFTGASASTMLSLDLEVRDNPILVATIHDRTTAGEVVDQATGLRVLKLATGPTGQGGDSMTQHGGITPDGRLIVGARTAPTVSAFDLTTGTRLLTANLRAQKSHVPQVILDRSGSAAYALVAEGHPRSAYNSGGADTRLVRLDTTTLVENGRLELGRSRNRDIALSPDGKTLLLATGLTPQGVIVVDLPSFTIRNRILTGFRPQIAQFTPNGAKIVIVGESVAIYDLEGTFETSYQTPGTNGVVMRAAFASPDLLWIGRRGELANIDLRDGTSQVVTGTAGRMLEIYDGKLYAGSGAVLRRLDLAGVVETQLTGFTNLDGHWVGRSPF